MNGRDASGECAARDACAPGISLALDGQDLHPFRAEIDRMLVLRDHRALLLDERRIAHERALARESTERVFDRVALEVIEIASRDRQAVPALDRAHDAAIEAFRF